MNVELDYTSSRERLKRACVTWCYTIVLFQCQVVAGLFHVFISDWLAVFPRDQILIIKMEDMRDDFYNVFAKIFKFLGLSKSL